tara:strand:+ start:755 stop:1051 length:297 start_codon:yes stop_codon:yes gene_type:complete
VIGMSENENKFGNITAAVKNGLSEEFGTLKVSINELSDKMDLTQKEKEGMSSVSDFVDHLDNCDNDDCEIHKSISTTANNFYMKGFLLGAKFGKQKRN